MNADDKFLKDLKISPLDPADAKSPADRTTEDERAMVRGLVSAFCTVTGLKERYRWMNIYEGSTEYSYISREEADARASAGRVACIPVIFVYREGEGL